MHTLLQILLFWLLAFTSLCMAVALLNAYSKVVDNDLSLHSTSQETAIAAFASLIEAVSVWAILSFAPTAARALFIPALIVATIYRIGHYRDWSRYDTVLLLIFQTAIACTGAALFSGRFMIAITIACAFVAFLAVLAAIIRSL